MESDDPNKFTIRKSELIMNSTALQAISFNHLMLMQQLLRFLFNNALFFKLHTGLLARAANCNKKIKKKERRYSSPAERMESDQMIQMPFGTDNEFHCRQISLII
jgi:hypothetical protein